MLLLVVGGVWIALTCYSNAIVKILRVEGNTLGVVISQESENFTTISNHKDNGQWMAVVDRDG